MDVDPSEPTGRSFISAAVLPPLKHDWWVKGESYMLTA
jgi:hypothetical protein